MAAGPGPGCARSRRSGAPLTRTVIFVIGALMTSAACSSDSNRTLVGDRITAVWEAAGVDPAGAQVLGYARTTRPRAAACADLPEDQRWWGKQTSTLPPGKVTQSALLERLGAGLEDQGYEVRRYKSSGSETRILDAVNDNDGVHVQLFVTGGGGASLDVKAGPCATRLRTEPEPPYLPER